MFTRKDIVKLDNLNEVVRAYYQERRYPYSVSFNNLAFEPQESEQSILISRAEKRRGENGLFFWIVSHQTEDWGGREDAFQPYIYGGQCEPISETRFNEMVSKRCEDLVFPLMLPLRRTQPILKGNGFIGALLMRDEWNLVDIFAEYEDEYLHFYWDTTA